MANITGITAVGGPTTDRPRWTTNSHSSHATSESIRMLSGHAAGVVALDRSCLHHILLFKRMTVPSLD